MRSTIAIKLMKPKRSSNLYLHWQISIMSKTSSKTSSESTVLINKQGGQSREDASFFSKLFFLWLNPLFHLAKEKETIEPSDLEEPHVENSTVKLCQKLEREWKDSQRSAKTKVKLKFQQREIFKLLLLKHI